MCDFLKLHVDRQNSGMSCCSDYNDKELKQSEAFSLLICLDDIKLVLLNLFSHIETIWLTIWLTICAVVIFRDDYRTGCRNVSHCQQQQSLKWLDIFTSDLRNRPFWFILACSSTFAGLANSFVLTWKSREFDLCFGDENVILIDVNTAR